MDKKDFSFNLSTDEMREHAGDLGVVGGCIAAAFAIAALITLSLLLSPIVGVSAWKLVLILFLARFWFV